MFGTTLSSAFSSFLHAPKGSHRPLPSCRFGARAMVHARTAFRSATRVRRLPAAAPPFCVLPLSAGASNTFVPSFPRIQQGAPSTRARCTMPRAASLHTEPVSGDASVKDEYTYVLWCFQCDSVCLHHHRLRRRLHLLLAAICPRFDPTVGPAAKHMREHCWGRRVAC